MYQCKANAILYKTKCYTCTIFSVTAPQRNIIDANMQLQRKSIPTLIKSYNTRAVRKVTGLKSQKVFARGTILTFVCYTISSLSKSAIVVLIRCRVSNALGPLNLVALRVTKIARGLFKIACSKSTST